MNKVKDIFGNILEFHCMGCDIANRKLIPPGGFIYDDGFITVTADPEIPIKGFIILGIKKHIKSMNELTVEERNKIIKILNRSIEIIKEINLSNEILTIQEETSSHFHIWIMPTYEWMNQFGKGVRYIKEYIDYASSIANPKYLEELLNIIEEMKLKF